MNKKLMFGFRKIFDYRIFNMKAIICSAICIFLLYLTSKIGGGII